MSICRKLTKAIKGLYDSAVCKKAKFNAALLLGKPRKLDSVVRLPAKTQADDHQPVNDRESFIGILFLAGTEVVVLNVAVSDFVNNLFCVDERQALRFITIAKLKD